MGSNPTSGTSSRARRNATLSTLAAVLTLASCGPSGPTPRAPQVRLLAPTSDWVEVEPGVELHVERYGVAGAPVVLVPNAAQKGLQAWLATDFEVVGYDSRGRGRSRPGPAELEISMERDIEDLARLLDELGLDRPVALYGSSYYGAVALRFAARWPGRVAAVIAEGPLPVREATWLDFADRTSEEAETTEAPPPPPEALAPAERCRRYYHRSARDLFFDPEVAAAWSTDFCDLDNEHIETFLGWVGAIFESIPSWDFRAEIEGLEVPTLLVQGLDDRTVPPTGAREWSEVLGGRAELLEAEQAAHLPLRDRPDLRPAALAFLRSHLRR